MFGTIVNTLAIIAGSLAGVFLKGGLPKRYTDTIMQAIGLAVILIGLQGALKSGDLLLIIFSLAIGSVIGELMGIEARLEDLGQWLERRFSSSGDGIAKGFVAASLLFCVGSMAIVGSLESGLTGNHQTLFAKSVLDGISSVVFASSLGIGVIFSAVSVFLYQGFITLTAAMIKPFLIPAVVEQMSGVGGLLIMGIGINMMEIKRVKVGNMLPAIFIPLVWFMLKKLWM
ncbi:DUF554 domain-containing protein [Desulfonema ishimotonii]|uniref:DUF554 domain-containing protein n=1 Tax=Desulfonema ishimotonii TaxID=45657 RepID=A0A401FXB7_9BACT|nr:DUF554 domain-containing protein [Desulfonema ishimotonii]GBC61610.1 DUF554 domain-containing protein [Desulfonema ishimotonii]